MQQSDLSNDTNYLQLVDEMSVALEPDPMTSDLVPQIEPAELGGGRIDFDQIMFIDVPAPSYDENGYRRKLTVRLDSKSLAVLKECSQYLHGTPLEDISQNRMISSIILGNPRRPKVDIEGVPECDVELGEYRECCYLPSIEARELLNTFCEIHRIRTGQRITYSTAVRSLICGEMIYGQANKGRWDSDRSSCAKRHGIEPSKKPAETPAETPATPTWPSDTARVPF
jgi:hypothetical protein